MAIEVTTQKQLEKALAKTNNGVDELIYCIGSARFTARENSTVTARENSTVTARENSTVTAWENSTVTARENSTVRAFARAAVEAAKHSVVLRHSKAAKIKGGRILDMHIPKDAADWCEFYGVEIRKGGNLSRELAGKDAAILFKALNENFVSSWGACYEPGATPSAPDWDGGTEECGGGLHFSPHPQFALEFAPEATKFAACPVLVSEICIHPEGCYPNKVKAPKVCAPCWEVDRDGERIE